MPWEIVILALVGVAALALVAWPFVGPAPDAPDLDPLEPERSDLEEQLGRSLGAIREIEVDHRAGNLSDEDFADLDQAERARAVEIMRRVEALSAPTARVEHPAS